MHTISALAWTLILAQAQTIPTLVPATVIDATMRASVAGNILDTKMKEAVVKGAVVRVGLVHRTNAEAAALLHQDLTEIYSIIEGSGTLVIGGTMTNQRPVSDPPNLGPTPSFSGDQVGGVSQKIGPRDVVIVPAGQPHRFVQLDGPISYVIYRFEPSAK